MKRVSLFSIVSLSLAVPAYAQDDVSSFEEAQTAAAQSTATQVAPEETESELVLAPLSDEELGEQRGRYTVVVGNQTLTAVTAGGVVNGDYTAGSVTISDNAFSQFHGLGNVLINTGAFANLQGGVSVVINTDGGQ